jgi:putative phosphoribosyl transferase
VPIRRGAWSAPFRDRIDGGRQLADLLRDDGLVDDFIDPLVLALPRGGVPVGFEVAAALDAPLDVIVACKVGAPGHQELGIGAVAEGLAAPVLTADLVAELRVGSEALDQLVARAHAEVERRVQRYRNGRPLRPLDHHEVLVVDDGLATGVTARAALGAAMAAGARRLWFAAPVCSPTSAWTLRRLAEEIVCIVAPYDLGSVGAWYDDFSQTSDDEVVRLLTRAAAR